MKALGSRLYLRIWLAVVAAVVLITVAVGWAWRISREASPRELPVREIVLRNAAGEVIAQAQGPAERRPGRAMVFELQTVDGQQLELEVARPARAGGPPHAGPPDRPGGGWLGWRPPLSFFWLLVLVALAVALGAYPVIRRLTQRLEALQSGVERWGRGDLSARVAVQGHDEVAFLAERFNQAAERIERLLASHKALLANASHELRSPLARIRMSVELLEPETSPLQRQEIARSIRELDQLIDEILLASRLDSHEVQAEPSEQVDLLGLAAEECARIGAQLQEPPAGSGALELQGSPRLLRRLLRNLLENAVRHGGQPVTLTIDRQASALRLQVCDGGSGVPPAYRERIFEPFFRLPGASEKAGGVGLGLALVRSIARSYGGEVLCLEAPGGGSCFEVRLPYRHPGVPAA